VALGLVDAGYTDTEDKAPSIWIGNANGEKVLKHLSAVPDKPWPKLDVQPRAKAALSSMDEQEQLEVLVAAESFLGRDSTSRPREDALLLDPIESVFLLRVSPELRAFVRLEQDHAVELVDIVREDTLKLFLERYGSADESRDPIGNLYACAKP
jgi:hypothetical protein